MLPDASADFYRRLQRLQLVVVAAGRKAWSRMGPDFDPAWTAIAPSLVTVAAAAQLAAARTATEYVPAVLAETGQPDEPDARVRPQAFAGHAADGRSLTGLLSGAVVAAKRASQDRVEVTEVEGGVIRTRFPGLGPEAALAVGGRWMDSALRGVVTDAARDATAAELIVREDMGWVRMINPPCCSRCAVLAGKWFSWRADFDRHPNCDCTAIPASENRAGDFTTDPQLLVERGLVTDLTKSQRDRLAEGADLPKVLNESRDRWRVRMAADRRDARYANYTPAERRAADRRAAARVASGEDIKTVHDFMAHLTNRVDALTGMRTAGIVT